MQNMKTKCLNILILFSLTIIRPIRLCHHVLIFIPRKILAEFLLECLLHYIDVQSVCLSPYFPILISFLIHNASWQLVWKRKRRVCYTIKTKEHCKIFLIYFRKFQRLFGIKNGSSLTALEAVWLFREIH